MEIDIDTPPGSDRQQHVERLTSIPTGTTPTSATAITAAAATSSAASITTNATTTTNNITETASKTGVVAGAESKTRKVVRRRKKKKAKEGPKFPLTGYIRFMNVRREELRVLQPDATTIEVTKLIGAEWNALAEDVKRPYLAAAKIDFERYNLECIDYKKTLSDKAAAGGDSEADSTIATVAVKKSFKSKDKESKHGNVAAAASAAVSLIAPPKDDNISRRTPADPISKQQSGPQQRLHEHHQKPASGVGTLSQLSYTSNAGASSATTLIAPKLLESRLELQQLQQQQQQQRRRTSAGNYDIPIFTEEFLDHNKHVDLELRLLRKSNTDFDQQNAVLERHVEHMNTGVAKLQADSADLARTNAALQAYLGDLSGKLSGAFGAIAIPGHAAGATVDTVYAYMEALSGIAAASGAVPTSAGGVLNRARDVLMKLEL